MKIMKLKKTYTTPEIEVIKLDNEISLQLSSPYSGPGEGGQVTGASAAPRQQMETPENDPYQWEN